MPQLKEFRCRLLACLLLTAPALLWGDGIGSGTFSITGTNPSVLTAGTSTTYTFSFTNTSKGGQSAGCISVFMPNTGYGTPGGATINSVTGTGGGGAASTWSSVVMPGSGGTPPYVTIYTAKNTDAFASGGTISWSFTVANPANAGQVVWNSSTWVMIVESNVNLNQANQCTNNNFSGINSITQYIGATNTTVTSSLNPSHVNESVTFTATVSNGSSGSALTYPTGTVTFYDAASGATCASLGASATLGSGTLSNGTATYTTANLSLGTHTVLACYGGDTGNMASSAYPSTSTPVDQQVVKYQPQFYSLTPSQQITRGTASVSLSGQLHTPEGVAPPVGSTVTVTIAGLAPITTTTTDANGSFSATFVTSSLTMDSSPYYGSYPITYSYAGDGSFTSASDASTVLTVIDPTLVTLDSFKATSKDGGVVLEWRTGREVSNLGFHIYRDGVRLTSSPVAGSALLAGAQTILPAGNSYSWFDPDGNAANSYTLEDLDLNGGKTTHGPIRPEGIAPAPKSAKRTSVELRRTSLLLSQIGRGGSGSGESLQPRTRQVPPAGHANTNQQALLAAGPTLKIGISREGWYRVNAAQLIAAGMPPDADPRRLQLFAEGREQGMVVRGSGRVESVEFYGTGIDTTFSDTRVYWLTWDGRAGTRAQSVAGNSGGDAPAGFPATLAWRPRSVYFAALNNGDADNFFGPVVTSTDPVSQALPVTHFGSGSGSSTLQVTMQGVTIGDHAVVVRVNGSEAGILTFHGQANSSSSFSIPTSLLREGDNALTLATYGAGDVTAVDSVLLTYPHAYTADDDFLRFTAETGAQVTVDGFTTGQIQVVDVTDPANPILVPGSVASRNGGYAVSFGAPGEGERTLLAFTTAKESQPASITANHPSSWRARQAGADMVIIGHAAFLQSLSSLVTLRQKQGHSVSVVDVEDLYDEFSFGEQTPYAIKDFLANAQSVWTTKPHWVLLVGDATSDPRDYLKSGKVDYVPAKLVGTSQLETSSDDWFVDFDDDGIPDMAIGRLPADSPASAAAMVGKIIGFEQAGNAGWKKKALLVAGRNDSDDAFERYTAQVQALLPLAETKVLAGTDSQASAGLVAAINSGVGLVNYAGHGSTELWEGLLDSTATQTLTNGDATPFVISMTCLNGYFQDVYTTSLAEALMAAPKGGAAAVWASSSLTGARSQAALDQAMVSALYGAAPVTVGEAAIAAKKAVNDLDVRRTWILFGDPAMIVQ